jgi:hypothetical protein
MNTYVHVYSTVLTVRYSSKTQQVCVQAEHKTVKINLPCWAVCKRLHMHMVFNVANACMHMVLNVVKR